MLVQLAGLLQVSLAPLSQVCAETTTGTAAAAEASTERIPRLFNDRRQDEEREEGDVSHSISDMRAPFAGGRHSRRVAPRDASSMLTIARPRGVCGSRMFSSKRTGLVGREQHAGAHQTRARLHSLPSTAAG